jgi:hypothetical protein
MLRRLLNIASIVCLVLSVALMGMWVRSYHRREGVFVHLSDSRAYAVWSVCGHLWLDEFPPENGSALTSEGSEFMSERISDVPEFPREGLSRGRWSVLGFQGTYRWDDLAIMFATPYWLLVLTSGSLAMLFRVHWRPRFTLRHLFIATTFVAVVLGIIAWLDRAWIGR